MSSFPTWKGSLQPLIILPMLSSSLSTKCPRY
jgi:hypothetical protein